MISSTPHHKPRFIVDKIFYIIAATSIVLAVSLFLQFNFIQHILIGNAGNRQEFRSNIKTNLILNNGVSQCLAALISRDENSFNDGLDKVNYSIGYIVAQADKADVFYSEITKKIKQFTQTFEILWDMKREKLPSAITPLINDINSVYLALANKESSSVQAAVTLQEKQRNILHYLGIALFIFISSIIGMTGWALKKRNNAEKQLIITNRGLEDTVRKRTFEIQQSEKQYKSLVESTKAIAWELDLKTLRFLYMSPHIYELTGYKAPMWTDMTFFTNMVHPDDRGYAIDYSSVDASQGNDYEFEYRLITADKQIIWIKDLVTIIREDDTPVCLRGYLIDISEQKQLELSRERLQRSKKMEAIGLMAGGVAHDLNNILSGIIAYPELLLQTLPPDSNLRKPIQAILDSGQRAATVVADLLTVARGAASIREVHNINQLIEEYSESPECHKMKSLHPYINYLPQFEATEPFISCSPVHVKKCLMNLMINASEAIDDTGTIIVSTRNISIDTSTGAEHKLQPGDYAVLTVHDTGSGISPADMQHIFEPFYTKKVMGISGTGLGLAIVWNTMEDHDGAVLVESSPKGTSFHLYFPVTTDNNKVPIDTESMEELTGNGEHVLIVDDEAQLRDIASQILESLGYVVSSVSSGESAITFVKKEPVDLLMIDMLMEPGINGYQTYKKILEHNPTQKAIIVSGFSESDDVKATLKLGAGEFIKKPYSVNQLALTVKQILQT